MKKILLLFFLTIFSMYYTNVWVNILREKDSLMQEINANSFKYEVKSIDATIKDNDIIIPGKYGKKINKKESYLNMKKYRTYNELLTVMTEVKPDISVEDNYDKYIEKGNPLNKNISLVFIVDDNINQIIDILNTKKIVANIFIDGKYIKENENFIRTTNNQIELLSFNNKYEEDSFKVSLSYLKSLTGKDSHFCYTERKDEKILNLCKKLKLHVIKPYLVIENNLLSLLKKNINNGIVISIRINSANIDDLSLGIDYIRRKGYEIVTLDDLINENID